MEFLTNLYLPIYKKEDKREERELFIDYASKDVFIHYKGKDVELFRVNENTSYNDNFKFLIYYIHYIMPKGEIIFFKKDSKNYYRKLKDNENYKKTFEIIETLYIIKTHFNYTTKKHIKPDIGYAINSINNTGFADMYYLNYITTSKTRFKRINVKNYREGTFCNMWTAPCEFNHKDTNTFNIETKMTPDIFAIKRI